MSTDHPSAPEQPSFLRLFLSEMLVRLGLLLLAMCLSFAGAAVAAAVSGGDAATLVGALVGLAVGAAIYPLVMRRFNRRPVVGGPQRQLDGPSLPAG